MNNTRSQARTAARKMNRVREESQAGQAVAWDGDVTNVDEANSTSEVVAFEDGSAMRWVNDASGGWAVTSRR